MPNLAPLSMSTLAGRFPAAPESLYPPATLAHYNQPHSLQPMVSTRYQPTSNQPDPPLPPRMGRSYSTQPAMPPTPEPRERRTFKCPKCEEIFYALQHYRDHIKLCLKTS